MLTMPVVGIPVAGVDSRWLTSLGIIVVTAATLMFGNLTLDVSIGSIVSPNIVQGIGTAFVTVPLMSVAVGTLPKEEMGNASGIFNLFRNPGGQYRHITSTTFLAGQRGDTRPIW
jgi:MFS transporter, DHA2 family, multidrug resistance protein